MILLSWGAAALLSSQDANATGILVSSLLDEIHSAIELYAGSEEGNRFESCLDLDPQKLNSEETLHNWRLVPCPEYIGGRKYYVLLFKDQMQYSSISMPAGVDSIPDKAFPIPEPSTLIMLGLGLIMLAASIRRGFGKPHITPTAAVVIPH